jgi:hypothetical protein
VKRAELEKLKGVGIQNRMKSAGTPGRFGKDAAQLVSRRERREAEQAMGLRPFAVKLNSELIAKIHALQQQRGTDLNDVVAELLESGLAQINK